MKRQLVKNSIVEKVTDLQGLKLIELVVEFSGSGWNILELIKDLIKEGELIEIEYTLPNMNYRTKSFIVPKDTVINYERI